MIKRSYFYQIDTQEAESKYGHGVIIVKSWMPNPVFAMHRALSEFCQATGRSESVCKIVAFNRV